jgi:hypothetical protein
MVNKHLATPPPPKRIPIWRSSNTGEILTLTLETVLILNMRDILGEATNSPFEAVADSTDQFHDQPFREILKSNDRIFYMRSFSLPHYTLLTFYP